MLVINKVKVNCDKVKLRENPKDLTTTSFLKNFEGTRLIAVPTDSKNVRYDLNGQSASKLPANRKKVQRLNGLGHEVFNKHRLFKI